MVEIRKAKKTDFDALNGLFDFIVSLKVDILKEIGEKKLLEILRECFLSETDRYSYNNCEVAEKDGKILGFSFAYKYDNLLDAKEYWYNHIVEKYELNPRSYIFDFNEFFEGEYYLDTLYVFEDARGRGVGSKLLDNFGENKDYKIKSLNVAFYNKGAQKLYESFGYKKEGKIKIANEQYHHLVLK